MSKTQSRMNFKLVYRMILLGALLAVIGGCDASEEVKSRMACINNLKHVGAALVLYAHDHDNLLPQDFSVIADSNYLGQPPSVFLCPGEKNREAMETESWSTFDLKNISYSL
ncbi:MAG: hypothetical protein ACYTBS_27260, partial [Planctomycetota bacterium]